MDYKHSKYRELNLIKEGSIAKQRYLEIGAGHEADGVRFKGGFYSLTHPNIYRLILDIWTPRGVLPAKFKLLQIQVSELRVRYLSICKCHTGKKLKQRCDTLWELITHIN